MQNDSLQRFALRKLEALQSRRLKRELTITDRYRAGAARNDGAQLISFACNDYLGLSHHPRVIAASQEAARRYGVGAGASRLVTGNHPLYEQLETRLARLKGAEDAVVFGSGYLTNIGVIPALAGPGDLILMDELCHACLNAGAVLSRSTVLQFRHNDVAHAAELLQSERSAHRRCLMLTDGVFSMDGDLAPVAALSELADRHDAWLMTDDAHGLGVVGGGRGSSFAGGVKAPVPLEMGTLSKAVGAYGGYLCTTHAVAELMRNRARSFIYTTGLPPATVAAAIEALKIIEADQVLVGTPLERARTFTERLGLPRAQSPIVPLPMGAPERALRAGARLKQEGFLVIAIRPPTVPEGTARLRCTFSAAHREQDVLRFAEAVERVLKRA